ncbi:C25 family cysteine peptidase [Corallococcus llansteffanensis]|uniref:C25 family cysteine peptidase n=1 Tax=Corallococcus llansteffanensis TaxID=2316731 RepID=UPI0013158F5F|nr:C25 family cysteine peptidase [Corallococcus llansteffanensis]
MIAPEGAAGDRLLAILEPLRRWRAQQQGAPTRCYRVPPGLEGPQAVRWKNTVLRDESIPEQEWPRYLLVLGDLDQVSLELQQALGSDVFVGRLAFREEQQLAAYVDKVLRWERAPSPESQARSLFFTAHDGTAATQVGYHQLVLPSLQACRARQQKGDFHADIHEVGGPEDWSPQELLEQAAAARPGVLLSVSHGLGAPRQGWSSATEQQSLQGAMCLGPGEHLRAADVASRPFLPGGLWVYLACFGGGTPHHSPYFHWLRRLQESGARIGRPEAVLASLPRAGQPPFIAALPQAALANPNGPLALVAHVDLAWSYGFSDVDTTSSRGRPSRFLGLLRELVEGRRVGVGLSTLLRFASEANLELTMMEDRDATELAAGRSAARDSARRGHLWMMRQDVSGYVLLGDPAVRLPLTPAVARDATPSLPEVSALLGLPAPALAPASSPFPLGPGVQAMEEAVVEMMTGAEAPRAIATRLGVSLAELRHWERVFRDAGRAALASLSRSGG